MLDRKTREELLRRAEQTELVPGEDVALDVRGGQPGEKFAVALGEDVNEKRSPGERFSVSTARMAVLDGKALPMNGEPFTEFYARRRFAEARLHELGDELDCSTTR